MESDSDLTSLLQRASRGEVAAAEEILRTYGRGMLRAVRYRLKEELRRGFDSNDFTQAAWVLLLKAPVESERFSDAKALGAYLSRLGERLVLKALRRENTQKAGGRRLQPLDSDIAESSEAATRDPTPSQAAVAIETWERLVENLSPRDRRIVELRYQGGTNVEISAKLGISEATVRYVLEKLLEKAKDLK